MVLTRSHNNTHTRNDSTSSRKRSASVSVPTRKVKKAKTSTTTCSSDHVPKKTSRILRKNDCEGHSVDPEIGLYHGGHFLSTLTVVQNEDTKVWYDVVLTPNHQEEQRTTRTAGSNNHNNKYYHIQMLKDDNNFHYVWFKWGRVGEKSIGRALKGPFYNEVAALPVFSKKYSDKLPKAFISILHSQSNMFRTPLSSCH
jgi:hypothetical protein